MFYVLDYIRLWLPELSDVEDEFIFQPWKSAKAHNYPHPLIESEMRREECAPFKKGQCNRGLKCKFEHTA